MCEAYQRDYGMGICILRYHNIGPEGTYVGCKEKSSGALCRKVAQATAYSDELTIWGDGNQTRSYCYINDCVEGTILLMESTYNKPLNIGSERRVSINELADIILSIAGKRLKKGMTLLLHRESAEEMLTWP
jgi:nucleoside-diphosphate-sugar epimerase